MTRIDVNDHDEASNSEEDGIYVLFGPARKGTCFVRFGEGFIVRQVLIPTILFTIVYAESVGWVN